jgi:hypothetical protein
VSVGKFSSVEYYNCSIFFDMGNQVGFISVRYCE